MNEPMNEQAQRWIELDKQHVWHPFTQMQQWNQGTPLVIERADGNHLFDTSGRRYLDGVSSLWVTLHGHNRKEINDAIRAQLDRVAHSTLLGLANVPSIELAARLAHLAPGTLNKVFYSDSGSTAVEIALKQAFQYWQHRGQPGKRLFVHLEHSYHGDTLGAVGVGGIELFHHLFGPLLVPSLSVPSPHPYRHPAARTPEDARDQALAALAALLAERSHEIAAMIIEPLVQGAAGILVHPPGYLRAVAELCKQHQVLLIADEVATGLGRTGTMLACQQENVTPDFLCLAKGLTGGYLPLAATITTDEVYQAFLGAPSDYKAFYHGHTFTGNPVACAAAIASLDLFETDRVLHKLPAKIERLSVLLRERLATQPRVGDIRQKGLMVGIELVADRDTARPFPPERHMGARVCHEARGHGVIVRNLGDVVVLMPPLSITSMELELLVDAVARSIVDVCE
jgi:adenosylmethionine-8-amino-7-oxononanoate aminotransferase